MDYHVPVLLKESVEGLNIKPGGTYLDLTFGGGGHSAEILKHLKNGKLIAFDQDDDAIANTLKDERFLLINSNFRFFKNYLRYNGIVKVDGILADLGISSHHIDMPERGFSFMHDAVLDMRMSQKSSISAREVINSYPKEKLIRIFSEYGEVPNAGKLASVIIRQREGTMIERTIQFRESIAECIQPKAEYKYLAKVFQALRIEVNNEKDALEEMLLQTTAILNPGGRLVIITYHSLEDRLVKNFLKFGMLTGQPQKDIYGNADVPFTLINKKGTEPNEKEIMNNSRARSARLRIAEKIA